MATREQVRQSSERQDLFGKMAKVPSLPHLLTPTVGPSPPSSLKKYDLFQWILCSCSSPLSTPWPIIYLKPCLLQVTLLADPVGPVKMLHSYCSQLHPSSHMNFSLGTSVGFPGGSGVKKKKKKKKKPACQCWRHRFHPHSGRILHAEPWAITPEPLL